MPPLFLLIRKRVMGKAQHYNPVLQLRHFAGPEPKGHVWTYDKDTGDVRSSTPENTGFETHYYTLDNDDGTKDTVVEDWLATVEGINAPIYEKLISKAGLTDQERHDFAHFLAVQYFRTPSMRRVIGKTYGQHIQIMSYANAINDKAFDAWIRRYERDTGEVLDDEMKAIVRQRMIDPTGYELLVPKHYTVKPMFETSEKLAGILYEMTWGLLVAGQEGYFITGDNPVVRRVHKDSVHQIYGDGGFMNNTAEITYPLTPGLMLMLFWDNAKRRTFDPYGIPREYLRDQNRARATNAERFLYGPIKDTGILRLAVKYRTSKTDMKVEGFGPDEFAPVYVPRRWKTKRHVAKADEPSSEPIRKES